MQIKKRTTKKKQLFINITPKLLRQMQFPYAKTKGGNANYNYLNKTYQNSYTIGTIFFLNIVVYGFSNAFQQLLNKKRGFERAYL